MASFKWNAEVLKRETLSIDLPVGDETIGPNGEVIPAPTEVVTFREFNKRQCDEFISRGTEQKVFIEVDDPDNPGQKITQRVPITEISAKTTELINNWLSQATRGAKTPDFFNDIQEYLSSQGYGYLVDMLFELNHVDELLGVGGNYLMLPAARAAKEGVQAAVTK